MYAIHAVNVNGALVAFERPEWDAFFRQYLTYLPKGRSRAPTLKLLAWLLMGMKQKATFKRNAARKDVYGEPSHTHLLLSLMCAGEAHIDDACAAHR